MKPLEDLAVHDDADFHDQEFTAGTHDIPLFLGQAVRAGGPVPVSLVRWPQRHPSCVDSPFPGVIATGVRRNVLAIGTFV